MVGDAMRVIGADVCHLKPLYQELGELEDSGGKLLDIGGEALVVREVGRHGVELAYHADAGARGRHDCLVVLEGLDETLDERYRLALVAGVEMHLAAAGLREGESYLYPEAFEDLDRCPAGLGKEGVVEAGDKERNAHGRSPSLPSLRRRASLTRLFVSLNGSASLHPYH